ncbi:pyruvate kinase [Falsibacillus albus]|uniref:Pyruvate kinase n=1 Tax=Falsibacillus albus TaxID=2478915 RepID=A0A3L7JZ73_9BACI|nr:pyruvate kinase [Falsibacillus albus]RLQ95429.1 hypothetical protein D9X91_10355 [Falsibacillus albus]
MSVYQNQNVVNRLKLARWLQVIYEETIENEGNCLNEIDFSIRNLYAYLKLRRLRLHHLESKMLSEGLGSFKQSEEHVEHFLQKSIENLTNRPIGSEGRYDWWKATRLRKERATCLFGAYDSEKTVKKMVTMDMNMSNETIERLLKCGMDLARINCSHDSPGEWIKMIYKIKQIEAAIGNDGCQIFMDLPGPKIRVKNILYNPYTTKVSVNSDEAKQGMVAERKMNDVEDVKASFMIEIKGRDHFQSIEGNEVLEIKQGNEQKAKLNIIKVLDDHSLLVETHESFEVNQNCKLFIGNTGIDITNVQLDPMQMRLKKGYKVRIYLDENNFKRIRGNSQCACISVSHPKALRNVRLKDRVYFDDGQVEGKVMRITPDFIELLILTPSEKAKKIKAGKGVNFPDSFVHLMMPNLTNQDLKYLPVIIEHADIIGLSFVNHPQDVKKLKDILEDYGRTDIGIVAKIETKEGVNQLSSILEEGLQYPKFGVMIARGDLAVEIGFQTMISIQQHIISMCNAAHVPVIWATEVLELLTKKGQPSRSEISDVFLGSKSDCIMLNKGPYISESLKMLDMLLQGEITSNVFYRSDTRNFFQSQFEIMNIRRTT